MGVTAVDRLNIVAMTGFQEIVDEARKPDSAIRLQQVVLTEGELQQKTVTVESRPQLAAKLGLRSDAPAKGHLVSRRRRPNLRTKNNRWFGSPTT